MIYLKETKGEVTTKVAYTRLTKLLREMGIEHLYTSVRYILEKGNSFTYNNVVLRKIELKRDHYGKRP